MLAQPEYFGTVLGHPTGIQVFRVEESFGINACHKAIAADENEFIEKLEKLMKPIKWLASGRSPTSGLNSINGVHLLFILDLLCICFIYGTCPIEI